MNVVSVDLDDTLIATKTEYDEAKRWFGEYVSRNFDLSHSDAVDAYEHWDAKGLDEWGLSRYRFPNSAVKALKNLVDKSSNKNSLREHHKSRVYEIGKSVFKDRNQYRQNGFIDSGVNDFLNTIRHLPDKSILLTAGDSDIQNRKVDALRLRKYFDEIRIVDINGKQDVLEEFDGAEKLVHIGNSKNSDVKPASNVDADCIYIPRGEWIETNSDYEYNDSIYTVDNISEAESVLKEIFSD